MKLLKFSEDVQQLDLEKLSPLDLAAHSKNVEIIDYLIEENLGKFKY